MDASGKPHIVVTYAVKDARRAQIRGFFGDGVKLSFLADQPTGLREQTLMDADVFLTWNLPKELAFGGLGLLKNLRMIQLLSAGADHLPFREIPRDVVIASNVGAYAEPMAEHVLAMALALTKHLHREHANLAHGEFNQSRMNDLLQGSVCGILGFGGIGKAVARLMSGLGVRVRAVNTSGRTEEPVDFIGTLKNLDAVLTASDIVVVSLPLNKTTRGLIGKQELEAMKPDAILINVARGQIIDEKALYDHLVGHPEFKAGIDAWWFEPFGHGSFKTSYPFFTLPNVLGSPHNSAIVSGINEKATRLAIENVKRFLAREPIRGEVRREDYI
ncbi:MAG TPA: 2-hydroxyacid dehydrogenase [Nitrospirota bacterium]|nr:2-hydroxyacid dehydrogenase [Nitrospirota bacterium]